MGRTNALYLQIFTGKLRPSGVLGVKTLGQPPQTPAAAQTGPEASSVLHYLLSPLCIVTGDFGRAGPSPSHFEAPVSSTGHAGKGIVSVASDVSLASDGKWLLECAGLQAQPP